MLGVFSRGRQQQQQGQPPPTTQSWYPPSVAGPASSGRTRTPPPPPPNLGGRPSGGSPLSRTSTSEACSTSGGYIPPTSALASSPRPHTSNSVPSNSVAAWEKRGDLFVHKVAHFWRYVGNNQKYLWLMPWAAVKKAIFNYGPTFNNRSWCRPEELTLLLNDKDAYNSFLHSLDEVKRLDMISAELEKSTIYESKKKFS